MKRGLIILWIAALTSYAHAEKFDIFLDSISQHLPIQTEYMKMVLKKHGTHLAHPSLLEKWGLINQDAAATYNSVMNTIVLKEDYTTTAVSSTGKSITRVKSWPEMEHSQPNVWPIRLATIFHELSHAEYAWLSRSKESVDYELLLFLKTDFDIYLKEKYPKASAFDRKVARSELFAYYRDSFLTLLMDSKNEIFLQNAFFGSSYRCRKTEFLEKWFKSHPEMNSAHYVVFEHDVDFSRMPLPTIFVKGEEFTIDPNDAIYPQLQRLLWQQLLHHFAPTKTKWGMAQWMNTKPELLNLIKSCRQFN